MHPVIRLEMAYCRFCRLSSLDPAALLLGQRLVLAAMDDLRGIYRSESASDRVLVIGLVRYLRTDIEPV